MNCALWIYVSKSLVVEHEEAVLEDIVRLSRQRNQELGVTGCLIFSRGRFAQALEGSSASVIELRASIETDSRHTDVTTVDFSQSDTRRFLGWSMAYSGPSIFVEKTMADTIKDVAVARESNAFGRLLQMMEGFAASHTGVHKWNT